MAASSIGLRAGQRATGWVRAISRDGQRATGRHPEERCEHDRFLGMTRIVCRVDIVESRVDQGLSILVPTLHAVFGKYVDEASLGNRDHDRTWVCVPWKHGAGCDGDFCDRDV